MRPARQVGRGDGAPEQHHGWHHEGRRLDANHPLGEKSRLSFRLTREFPRPRWARQEAAQPPVRVAALPPPGWVAPRPPATSRAEGLANLVRPGV